MHGNVVKKKNWWTYLPILQVVASSNRLCRDLLIYVLKNYMLDVTMVGFEWKYCIGIANENNNYTKDGYIHGILSYYVSFRLKIQQVPHCRR